MTPQALARELPVYPSGVELHALQTALEARGWTTVVSAANIDDVAALLRAGAPVLAAVQRAGQKHMVTIVGIEAPTTGQGCGAPTTVTYIDPADGVQRTVPVAEFEALRWQGRQTLVIGPHGLQDVVSARLLAEDRRYRAEAFAWRATAHGEPNAQVVELLRRAVNADPCWADARAWLAAAAEATNVPVPTVSACSSAHEVTLTEVIE